MSKKAIEERKGDYGSKVAYRRWDKMLKQLKGKGEHKAAETYLNEAMKKMKRKAK